MSVFSHFDDFRVLTMRQINDKMQDPEDISQDVPKVYRFEKSGAPSVTTESYLHGPKRSEETLRVGAAAYVDVNPIFLLHHFYTCLLWHVMGGGRL